MVFKIKEGKKYNTNFLERISNIFFPILYFKKIEFKFILDDSCVYQLDKNTNGLQWNKLYGISYLGLVHRNSLRFGWRTNDNKTQVCSYIYDRGIVSKVEFSDIEVGELYKAKIELIDKKAIFYLENCKTGESKTSEFNISRNYLICYRNYPYFGGETPSPKDIKIIIEEL